MVKYAREPDSMAKTCKARLSSARVHFKNTHETAVVLKNMRLERAKAYLNDVIAKKECVPFKRYENFKLEISSWFSLVLQ